MRGYDLWDWLLMSGDFTISSQDIPDLNIILLYDYIIDREVKIHSPLKCFLLLSVVLFIIFPP